MGRKCSVYNCKSGYASQKSGDKVTVYRFPKDQEQRLKWVKSLPNELKLDNVTDYMGVCSLHFPSDVPLTRAGRYAVPTQPPSVFPNVPISCCGTPTPKSRTTVKATSDIRNVMPDEMEKFKELDSLKLDSFHETIKEKLSLYELLALEERTITPSFVSKKSNGAVPVFSVYFTKARINENVIKELSFEAYRGIKRVRHPNLLKGVITCWSQLDELVRFVCSNLESRNEDDSKFDFVSRQIEVLNTPKNSRLYKLEDLCQAFSWYARSRALYSELRTHLQLPSLSTLRKITRVAKNMDDHHLFSSFFQKQEERSRGCIIIVDEIYVKASLTYKGGVVFGYAADQPNKMATTLLCIMAKCLFSSEKFLVKLLPCHALTADFQYKCVTEVISLLESCGALVLGIIADNNRINQSCFRKFPKQCKSTPWIAKSSSGEQPLFLMYDPVHIFKNIRNNWLTEKTQKNNFPVPESEHVMASWSDLKELYSHESETLVKMSKLTKAAVSPTNVQKQNVSLALNVFCDQTATALKTSSFSSSSWKATSVFVEAVTKLWKLWNCKSKFQTIRLRDPHRIAISPSDDRGVQMLKDWAELATRMTPNGKRVETFTKDTANALHWTCRCFIDISQYLLETDTSLKHDYVCLGFFQQDDLEKHFGHFRMSAGCNYYVTVQDVLSCHSMDKAQLMLQHCQDLSCADSHHQCELCDKPLTDTELLLIDDLHEFLDQVSRDEKLSLFYVAGYVAFKHQELRGTGSCEETKDMESFTQSLNRGGLHFPSLPFFHLTLLAYLFFSKSREQSCRNRLVTILSNFPAVFHLDVKVDKVPLMRITNILFKRFCYESRGEEESQSKRKIAKLTSQSNKQ